MEKIIVQPKKNRFRETYLRVHIHSSFRERDVAPWSARSLMVRWVVGSILHGGSFDDFSRSSQCSTTGVTKAVVCAILSVGWCI